ncbi:uncharacterized protein BO88DRAFT_190201 [Aspergillus vadensis CBS 113365]|uniref:Uncharacterized protein n=1 Tax=Aspergillus vadensis (strain CBS 113365 / IMI 142717 / IBT 24658) TaxID=1448311 RepID=A0A319BKY0_ASPVC|nr:hypothetical protein BO88DRAFT_190201 [Aspergillus vadensis CBS 113365]PYH63958.1 hypothetical protein BO88DRAFT_190201 [Aspergillus vadensis CBS 113365]
MSLPSGSVVHVEVDNIRRSEEWSRVVNPLLPDVEFFLLPQFAMAAIMSGATFVSIIGFSYNNSNTQQYGLPDRGVTAFWKQLVPVLLEFIITTIIQFFSIPLSATRHVYQTLSTTIRLLYSGIITLG